jgi:hypothetical protein
MKFHEAFYLDPPKFQNIVLSDFAYENGSEMVHINTMQLELKNLQNVHPDFLLENMYTSDCSVGYKRNY